MFSKCTFVYKRKLPIVKIEKNKNSLRYLLSREKSIYYRINDVYCIIRKGKIRKSRKYSQTLMTIVVQTIRLLNRLSFFFCFITNWRRSDINQTRKVLTRVFIKFRHIIRCRTAPYDTVVRCDRNEILSSYVRRSTGCHSRCSRRDDTFAVHYNLSTIIRNIFDGIADQ